VIRLPAVHDPGGIFLRRALRAALLAPAALAIGNLVAGDGVAALFATFGLFVFVGLLDFGGSPRSRSVAYAKTTVVGGALIVLGTPVSDNAVAGAAAIAVITFAVRYAGALGGAVEASGVGLILATVLAVVIPARFDETGSRLAGWLAAGAVAALAAVVLWPRYERRSHLRLAAASSQALAEAVRDPSRSTAALTKLSELRGQYAATPNRPGGPWAADRAFRRLLDGLVRVSISLPLVEESFREGGVLQAATADALDGTATVPRTVARRPTCCRLRRPGPSIAARPAPGPPSSCAWAGPRPRCSTGSIPPSGCRPPRSRCSPSRRTRSRSAVARRRRPTGSPSRRTSPRPRGGACSARPRSCSALSFTARRPGCATPRGPAPGSGWRCWSPASPMSVTASGSRWRAALRSWGGSTEPGERDPALGKVWIRDWLKLLDERRPLISEAIDEIAGLASGPWWR
jgi:hypothetical protein